MAKDAGTGHDLSFQAQRGGLQTRASMPGGLLVCIWGALNVYDLSG